MPDNMFRREDLGAGVAVFTSPAHTFGTDAVLLADFAAPRSAGRAADLGTGCGIIPLLWTRGQCAPQNCAGVDIQPLAIEQFQTAIQFAGLSGRLSAVAADLRALKGVLPFGACDLVTCNPPYNRAGGGVPSGGEDRRLARHDDVCTIEDVCIAAKNLLKSGGRFCCCFPPTRLCDLLESMRRQSLEPKRLRFVHKNTGTAPYLVLAEGRRNAKPFLRTEQPLLLYGENGEAGAELRRIYGSFGQIL